MGKDKKTFKMLSEQKENYDKEIRLKMVVNNGYKNSNRKNK